MSVVIIIPLNVHPFHMVVTRINVFFEIFSATEFSTASIDLTSFVLCKTCELLVHNGAGHTLKQID